MSSSKHCWFSTKTAPMLGESNHPHLLIHLCFSGTRTRTTGPDLPSCWLPWRVRHRLYQRTSEFKGSKLVWTCFIQLDLEINVSWRTPGLSEACSDVGTSSSLEGNLPTAQLHVPPSGSYTIPVASGLPPQNAKTFTLQHQTPILPIQNQIPQMTPGMEPVRNLSSFPLQMPNLIFSFLGSTIISAGHLFQISPNIS